MAKIDSKEFELSAKRFLLKLANGTQEEVIAAAYEVRNRAAKLTPVNTGLLRAGWQVAIKKNTAYSIVVAVYNDIPYAASVEYGTKPHIIEAVNKKVLANKKTGQIFGPRVQHPGTKPRPMIRPAMAQVLPILKQRLKTLRRTK